MLSDLAHADPYAWRNRCPNCNCRRDTNVLVTIWGYPCGLRWTQQHGLGGLFWLAERNGKCTTAAPDPVHHVEET